MSPRAEFNQILDEAVQHLIEGLDGIEQCVRMFKDDRVRSMYLNPNNFGVLSMFLERGAGYEAASSFYEKTMTELREEGEELEGDDEEEDEEEALQRQDDEDRE